MGRWGEERELSIEGGFLFVKMRLLTWRRSIKEVLEGKEDVGGSEWKRSGSRVEEGRLFKAKSREGSVSHMSTQRTID